MFETPLGLWLIGLAAAYFVGAIPFGLFLGWSQGVDIREHGSGNLGATNAGRVLGKKFGIICLILDLLKGLLPTAIYGYAAGVLGDAEATAAATVMWLAVAVAAVVGHMFPVYLKFKGGKGVATGLGVFLGVMPVLTIAGLVGAVIWFLILRRTGYVSLASMLAAWAMPIVGGAVSGLMSYSFPVVGVYIGIGTLLAALVMLRHRTNIQRLRDGSEAKVTWAMSKEAKAAVEREMNQQPSGTDKAAE